MIVKYFVAVFKAADTSIMLSCFKASGSCAATQPKSLISRHKAIKWGCVFAAGGGGKLGQNISLYVPVIVYTPISSFTRRQRCRQIKKKQIKKAIADGLVVFSLKDQRSLNATYNYKQPKNGRATKKTPPHRVNFQTNCQFIQIYARSL